MAQCANCQRDNPDGLVFCQYCGEPVDPLQLVQREQTRELGADQAEEIVPHWTPALFDGQTRLLLHIAESDAGISVDIRQTGTIILGRRDPDTGLVPEVDLMPFNGLELGVSRQHAQITLAQDTLRLHDLGSTNATYLNGQRLTPHEPRILRDGDEIRLGRLKLRAVFIRTPEGAPTTTS
jgi:hypothetical protein